MAGPTPRPPAGASTTHLVAAVPYHGDLNTHEVSAKHLLQEMMTYKRACDSPSEQAFIARFLDPVPGMHQDGFGNRYLRLGDQPTTLFSAHTDSVHLSSGQLGLNFAPSDEGTFTDTAHYVGLVPECTNLSSSPVWRYGWRGRGYPP